MKTVSIEIINFIYESDAPVSIYEIADELAIHIRTVKRNIKKIKMISCINLIEKYNLYTIGE
jgi:DNA-binding MarR family transcriptional regulator